MIFNKQYEQKKLIGKGGFGNVYKVLDHKNKNFYALKFITIVENEETENLKGEYEKEIEVMKNIKNKYIVELIDNFYDKEYKGYCIVMELCDGNLRDIMNKYKPNGLSLKLINKILYQLNEALKTMIDNGYIHRDLKPENILIKYTDTNKTNFDIKLADFGLTAYNINSIIQTQSQSAGTPIYMAPEVESLHYNNKCDLWSLGIILYELYTNKYIFDSKNLKERKINREKGRIVKETDNEMINKLIRKLIQVDIEKRIGWEEYFNDDFFKIKEEEKDEKEEEKEKDKKEEENVKDEKEEEKEKDEKEEEKEKDVKEDEKEKDEKEEDKEKDVKEDEKEKDEKEKDVKEDEKEKDEKEESKLNSNLLVK